MTDPRFRGPHDHGGHAGDEGVGSVGEEAAKLFAALQGWTREHASDYTRAAHGLGEGHIADGSAACRVCPVCQLIAFVRGINPDSIDQLSHAAGQMLHALRGLLDDAQQGPDPHRGSPVEKIRLSDDDEPGGPRWP